MQSEENENDIKYINNFVPNVTPEDSKEMKKILENFYNASEHEVNKEVNLTNNIIIEENNISGAKKVINSDTAAMKKILEKMYNSAEKITENLTEISKNNDYVEDLFRIKNNSISIGNKYEIRVRLSETIGGKKNFYDIYEVNTGIILCKDLFVFEAAEAIVRLLNQGENLLSERIRNVVFYEQKYVKHRQDAAIYKKRIEELKRKKRIKESYICESKYNKSKEEALKSKKKIIEIINGIKDENK